MTKGTAPLERFVAARKLSQFPAADSHHGLHGGITDSIETGFRGPYIMISLADTREKP